jgi:hypothetical protein
MLFHLDPLIAITALGIAVALAVLTAPETEVLPSVVRISGDEFSNNGGMKG